MSSNRYTLRSLCFVGNFLDAVSSPKLTRLQCKIDNLEISPQIGDAVATHPTVANDSAKTPVIDNAGLNRFDFRRSSRSVLAADCPEPVNKSKKLGASKNLESGQRVLRNRFVSGTQHQKVSERKHLRPESKVKGQTDRRASRQSKNQSSTDDKLSSAEVEARRSTTKLQGRHIDASTTGTDLRRSTRHSRLISRREGSESKLNDQQLPNEARFLSPSEHTFRHRRSARLVRSRPVDGANRHFPHAVAKQPLKQTESYLLTNPKSALCRIQDITLFVNKATFESLSIADQEKLLLMIPEIYRKSPDFSLSGLLESFVFKQALRELQHDIKLGRYTKSYENKLQVARSALGSGKLETYKNSEFELWWGQKSTVIQNYYRYKSDRRVVST
ncbi:Asx homology domain-containing protein [Lipomyces arxii]|uniref:Asx homology domain-containing protein n=1 Tax=Lipomyces arxii TaxID=56418 RepID=UPI0034CD31EA